MAIQQSSPAWTPQICMEELEKRMENALRRVSGSIGFDIDCDKSRVRSISDSAGRAFDTMNDGSGPWFMRVGLGLLEAGSFKLGPGLSLKDMGAEILREFYNEGNAAFSLAQTALAAEARAYLQSLGHDDAYTLGLLEKAGQSFCMPDKELFTREAMPYVKESVSPAGWACMGALAGLAGGIALTRVPHVGVGLGLITGIAAFFAAKKSTHRRSEALIRQLPRKLYQILATEWNANIRRYADAVNAALGK